MSYRKRGRNVYGAEARSQAVNRMRNENNVREAMHRMEKTPRKAIALGGTPSQQRKVANQMRSSKRRQYFASTTGGAVAPGASSVARRSKPVATAESIARMRPKAAPGPKRSGYMPLRRRKGPKRYGKRNQVPRSRSNSGTAIRY